jgi:hypothetical protein
VAAFILGLPDCGAAESLGIFTDESDALNAILDPLK